MPRPRTAVFGLFVILILILVIPFVVLCLLTGMKDPLIRLGQRVARLGCRILGIRVEVSGLEAGDSQPACIYMANHLSFVDGPILAMAIRRPVRIILKKSIFRIPVLGIGMRHVGFVPVDRKGAKGGQKSIRRAARLMRERGYSFLVFPEGTRSRDGAVQAFRRGGFFLALESRAPVVPVRIQGTFEIMPRGQWYARQGTVRIAFRRPIATDGYTPETMGDLMDKVREAMGSTAG